ESGRKRAPQGCFLPGLRSHSSFASAALLYGVVRRLSRTSRASTAHGSRWLHVAPMMQHTDRHLRCLMRLLSRELVLWTEMVKDTAIVRNEGDKEALHRILDTLDTPCSPKERPMVLQLGGSNPKDLAEAVRIARPWGFDEINLNCGCPSPKVAQVQDGLGFGAQLMKNPELVRQCTQAMCEQAAPGIEVSVKCRIGTHRSLDDMERDGDNLETLLDFIDTVSQSGVKRFAVHARSGILSGLNPDKNRKVPPLRHDLVCRLAEARDQLSIA
ncbi:unnamed protein product, partial [Polarella glacialis]